MILFPAIDLKDGNCVRLFRGDMQQATVFHDNPAEQARIFQDQGFAWIHVVDLNGAVAGHQVNEVAISKILDVVDLPIQLGGGIRSLSAIEGWLKRGITRVVLGTAAVNNQKLVREACLEFPGQVAVGIDARNGNVATEGWINESSLTAVELAKSLEDAGVAVIIYTDIERDGALVGLNVEETEHLAHAIDIPIIASGGVSSLEDIRAIKAVANSGILGVISGRAIYEGTLDPASALALCSG